jgi:hypothetical protein
MGIAEDGGKVAKIVEGSRAGLMALYEGPLTVRALFKEETGKTVKNTICIFSFLILSSHRINLATYYVCPQFINFFYSQVTESTRGI